MEDRISVFIIDDDLDDQVLMRQAFESAGEPVDIRFATRSDDAFEQLSTLANGTEPGIIVSDYNMPMMNGEEFLRKLATMSRYSEVPKVIVSTAASPSIVNACMANGATRYFVKPADFTELVELAGAIISLAKKTNN